MLRDANGLVLESGLYTGPDLVCPGDTIYRLNVQGESFTAEYWDGFVNLTNFEESARHFRKLVVPLATSRFLSRVVESPDSRI